MCWRRRTDIQQRLCRILNMKKRLLSGPERTHVSLRTWLYHSLKTYYITVFKGHAKFMNLFIIVVCLITFHLKIGLWWWCLLSVSLSEISILLLTWCPIIIIIIKVSYYRYFIRWKKRIYLESWSGAGHCIWPLPVCTAHQLYTALYFYTTTANVRLGFWISLDLARLTDQAVCCSSVAQIDQVIDLANML